MKPLEAIPIATGGSPPRDWLAAALWSMFLSCQLICVYCTCLWITDHRGDVTTLMFDWEWGIPFVPWMIVPYASIALLYAAAPFVCATEQELATLVGRLTFVVYVAGACFLLYPLAMGLPRQPVEGVFATWYEFLDVFDRPYNLAPSLHIAHWAILWTVYGRHARGVLRWLAFCWFALIALSTLFTWQHHVLDIVTGQALGLLAIYVFRERTDDRGGAGDEPVVTRDLAMTGRYAAVAAALAGAGWVLRPWGLLLL